MPKKGQGYAPKASYADAIKEFGEAAVHSLGRPDNLKKRGVTAHGLVTLLRREVARLKIALAVSARVWQETDPARPEAPMSPEDRRAYELFQEFANNREGSREHEWRMVREFILFMAEVHQQEARQQPTEKPDTGIGGTGQ